MACNGCKKKNKTVGKVVTETVNQSEFILRSNLGAIQIEFGSGLFISSTNCNNDLAVEFLKANPNRISMFETYPNNWKELISASTIADNFENTDEDTAALNVSDKASNEAVDAGGSK